MRFASWTPVTILVFAALGCAVACGDDDDDDMPNGKAGSSAMGGDDGGGKAGSANKAGSAAKGGESSGGGENVAEDSQLCTDLGGPAGIDAVVRGDGKTDEADPFNGFKFEKGGRQASVLLNVATDPCIGQQFAHLLAPAAAEDLEHLAQCLSLFVQNTAGCAVPYAGAKDTNGNVCKPMKAAHTGKGITEEDYTALIMDAATALIAAGVSPTSEQFKTVAMALTADDLRADIVTSDSEAYSLPGGMCEAGGMGAGGASGGGASMGGAGGAQ